MENLDKKGLGALSNGLGFESTLNKEAAIGGNFGPGLKAIGKSIPSWKTNTALASTAIGGIVGYNSSSEGNKGMGAIMGAGAGMGIGSTFRPQIKQGINYIKNLDVQGLKPQSNPMGGPSNGRTAASFKKVQRDSKGNIIPWNNSKGW